MYGCVCQLLLNQHDDDDDGNVIFLQRVSIAWYAERGCTSYGRFRLSVRVTVRPSYASIVSKQL